jgi:hypothetical protein
MQKKMILVIFLLLFSCPSVAESSDWSGNVNGVAGIKMLKESDWGHFDDQGGVGVMADFKRASWPISMSANLLYSRDSSSDYHDNEIGDTYYYTYYAEEASTAELNLGVKKIWAPADRFNFYVGGGLAVIYGEMEITRANNLSAGTYWDRDTEDDAGLGGWGAVGCYVTFASHLNIGVDLRYSSAEIDLYDKDIDAGGVHVGLLMGYAW